MNARTARAGVLPAKGDKQHEVHYLRMSRIVSNCFELSRVPAPQELLAAQANERARLLIEERPRLLGGKNLCVIITALGWVSHWALPPPRTNSYQHSIVGPERRP